MARGRLWERAGLIILEVGWGGLHQHLLHDRLRRLQVPVGLLARDHHPREHGEGVDVGRGGDDRRVGEELGSLCACNARRADSIRRTGAGL